MADDSADSGASEGEPVVRPSDPTGASAMDELVARAEGQLERMRDLGDRMAGVSARESSPDGAVTVAVDGNGALLDLTFSARVNRMTPTEFEQAVVSTAHEAAARAFARRGDIVTDFNRDDGAHEIHRRVTRS